MTEDIEPKRQSWTKNPEAVRADILRVATKEFAEHGLSGARINEIVRKTKTSKRMIYYYFGNKDGLYLSVLEAAYARVRAGEGELELEALDPVPALQRLVEFTFDFHRSNQDFVRLIIIENIHRARHLKQSETVARVNLPAIQQLEALYQKGVESGDFRPGLDPVSLHWLITSSCVFNVSNRSTFGHIYGENHFTDGGQSDLKALVVRSVVNAVVSAPRSD